MSNISLKYKLISLWNESLDSDNWWSPITPRSRKRTIAPHLHSLITTYDIGNPSPGLGQAQKCVFQVILSVN